jgi:hypothetical protein
MVFARFSLSKKLVDRDGHAHAWLVRIDSTCYGIHAGRPPCSRS